MVNWFFVGGAGLAGLLVALLIPSFAGRSAAIRRWLMSKVLNSNSQGWLLRQTGNRWRLTPVEEFREDAGEDGAFIYEDDDGEEQYVEDPANLMRNLIGVPLGILPERGRVLGDAQTADLGMAVANKDNDHRLSERKADVIQRYHDSVVEEEVSEQGNRLTYVNPWAALDELRTSPRTVDIRTDGGAATAATAAETATQGENPGFSERIRALTGLGDDDGAADDGSDDGRNRPPDEMDLEPAVVKPPEIPDKDQDILEEMKDQLVVGVRESPDGARDIYANPYAELTPDRRRLVDPRGVVELLKHGGAPDTPRKAAKNAREAERAFDRLGGVKGAVIKLGYVMVGAVATYLGTTAGGGGGGGGGSVSLPIIIDIATAAL